MSLFRFSLTSQIAHEPGENLRHERVLDAAGDIDVCENVSVELIIPAWNAWHALIQDWWTYLKMSRLTPGQTETGVIN
jgi:hypothetical protein